MTEALTTATAFPYDTKDYKYVLVGELCVIFTYLITIYAFTMRARLQAFNKEFMA